jgi:hypothetical protein
MIAVPGFIPEVKPVVLSISAMLASLLLHDPPG